MSTIIKNAVDDSGIQKLPRIVFGTSSLGNLYQTLDDDTKRDIVAQWFSHSEAPVLIDTAGKYGAGLALESIAKALKELRVDPEDVVICNKLGWRQVPLTGPEPLFEPGVWVDLKHDAVQDISGDGIVRCWQQGNELLAPYRTGFGSVHDPDEYLASAQDDAEREKRWDDILEAYESLHRLKAQGEIKAIGVGSKDWRVSRRLAEQCDLDWVMLATSLTIYSHPRELIEFVDTLHARGIAVINSAVFNAGFMTGGDFFDYRKITGESEEDRRLLRWRDEFHNLCALFGVTPAEACVAFGMSHPGVLSTALNSSRPERTQQNVRLCNAAPPAEFWAAMKSAGLIQADYPYLPDNKTTV